MKSCSGVDLDSLSSWQCLAGLQNTETKNKPLPESVENGSWASVAGNSRTSKGNLKKRTFILLIAGLDEAARHYGPSGDDLIHASELFRVALQHRPHPCIKCCWLHGMNHLISTHHNTHTHTHAPAHRLVCYASGGSSQWRQGVSLSTVGRPGVRLLDAEAPVYLREQHQSPGTRRPHPEHLVTAAGDRPQGPLRGDCHIWTISWLMIYTVICLWQTILLVRS